MAETTINHGEFAMDFPQDFRCPISMELMKDPVTISTGVTYDRKNIEKWFHTYKKATCPATMQLVDNPATTPNHTLNRLILSWLNSSQSNHDRRRPPPPPQPPSSKHDELAALLAAVNDSTPFKVSSLRKLRSVVENGDHAIKEDFKKSGGVEALVSIMVQILSDDSGFTMFRACEEALGVLNQIPFSDEVEDEKILQLLMNPNCMKSMAAVLQRGGAEARFCAVSTFQKIAKADYQWYYVAEDQGVDFFKSLLEISSDEISTAASSCALQLFVEMLEASKKSRLKAVEAGAVCTLVELLPDSIRPKRCERIMQLIKLLCECAEGRAAFAEHGLGIAAVGKKMLSVSGVATKIGVKILWLVSSFHSTERVLEEMLVCGAVKKLVALLHIGGRSTTKERVVKILKMHGRMWRRYPCFPGDVKEYLGLEGSN
ncbi:hypothetical protein ABFX02_02G135200 [Erythranthe guttata]